MSGSSAIAYGIAGGALSKLDYHHRRGDTAIVEVPQFVSNGVPVDMSEWTGWTAAVKDVDGNVLATLTVDSTYAVEGKIDVILSSTATSETFPVQRNLWDVQGDTPEGDRVTVCGGYWHTYEDYA